MTEILQKSNKRKNVFVLPVTIKDDTVIFYTKTGGYPVFEVYVSPEYILKEVYTHSGKTTTTETEIRCKWTKLKDKSDRPIFLLPNGVQFVFDYQPGGARDTDMGRFESPE